VSDRLTIVLSGDVMTGRGIDQVLPHPGSPKLRESFVRDAREYVELAERVNGPISRPVGYRDVWGDALAALEALHPDATVINLETSVTTSGDYWPGKSVHYRMHPANVECLTAARIDCCVLANNHVLDFGYAGLEETLDTLGAAGLTPAGAGRNSVEAAAPAVVDLADTGRLLVFAFGSPTSGIPRAWAADEGKAGVNLLYDLSAVSARRVTAAIDDVRRPQDSVVVSVHWGGNWGYAIDSRQREFAHALIDGGAVDAIHGHSSHHAQGIEIHRGKPIIYGCGDFLNDYEGIAGYEWYRGDLALLYAATFAAPGGALEELRILPFEIRRFAPRVASADSVEWIEAMLNREGAELGTRARVRGDSSLVVTRR
jgi:poly-gamma-glutamate capsule biosynthesis protein CapA/YwtB (metallophosphatase superfamily)